MPEVSSALRLALYLAWKSRCAWCGLVLVFRDMEVDHLIPKSLSGDELRHALELHELPVDYDLWSLPNLVPSCRWCNGSKGSRLPPDVPIISMLLDKAQIRAADIAAQARRFASQVEIERALAVIMSASEEGRLDEVTRKQLVAAGAVLDEPIRQALAISEPGDLPLEAAARLWRDPDLEVAGAVGESSRPGTPATGVGVGGLPRVPRHFLNRTKELRALDRLLHAAQRGEGPVVAVLGGLPGVGKSTLGACWARRNQDRFPGGILYGDFSRRRDGRPVDAGEVLGGFLRELGAHGVAIPADLAERQRMYRRLTAGRPVLVVLDDVDYPAQVRVAIPAGAQSVAIVTGKSRMEELLADGAEHLSVEPLKLETARKLVKRFAGARRVAAEPAAVDAVVAACGALPIALCVCGARLAGEPALGIGHLARQIADRDQPLRLRLASIFGLSYGDLAPEAAVVYRRLGLHPGPEYGAAAVAALVGFPLRATTVALDVLFERYLVQTPAYDRYRLHQLVRDHARECVEREDDEEEREGAMRRLVDWYYASLRSADRAVVADRLRLSEEVNVPTDWVPVFESPAAAFRWYSEEADNVMAVLRAAAEREWDDRVWQIAEALWPWCYTHRRYSEWTESHLAGIASARRLRDPAVEARLLSQLARARAESGDAAQAAREMAEAEAAVARSDSRMLRASVREFGGMCALGAGEVEVAREAFLQAREMFAACDSARGVAIQEYHLGCVMVLAGEPERALDHLDRSIATLGPIGDDVTVGRARVREGEALAAVGRLDDAAATLQAGAGLMARLEINLEQAQAFETLASVFERLEEQEAARRHRQRAYHLYKEMEHPRAEVLLPLLGP